MLRKHLLTLGLLAITGLAQAAETIDVYRDPNCGCCKAWISTCVTTVSASTTMSSPT